MYIESSLPPPALCNWISLLCGTPWNTWESIVTYHAFQLPFNFIIFQTTFHCHWMMKWNYNIRIYCDLTENWMHSVSQLRCKCSVAAIERAIFYCSCSGRAWPWNRKQGIFPLVFFKKIPCFTCLSFSEKTGISEQCIKYVKLASREQNYFIASNSFMAPVNAKICRVLRRLSRK
jgi:hypothetical protein